MVLARYRRGAIALMLGLTICIPGCSERDSDSSSISLADVVSEAESKPEDAETAPPSGAAELPPAGARERYTEEALEDLDRSSAFLVAQPHFSFLAVLAYDVLQEDGQLIEFGGTRRVLVRRPDRVRFESTDRSGEMKTLYFDGTTISVDLPAHDAFVAVESPGTLYAAVDHLVEKLGIPAPLEDLISLDYGAQIRERIESGYFVDTDIFAGRRCMQLAYRTSDVDVQLWIEEGERPLPCRIIITYRGAEGSPQFRAQLVEWDLDPEVPDDAFEFTPPAGAVRVPVTMRPGPAAQIEGES
jgi:hypothetical protein